MANKKDYVWCNNLMYNIKDPASGDVVKTNCEVKEKTSKFRKNEKYLQAQINTQLTLENETKPRWVYINFNESRLKTIPSKTPERTIPQGKPFEGMTKQFFNVAFETHEKYSCIDCKTGDQFRLTGEEVKKAIDLQRDLYKQAHPLPNQQNPNVNQTPSAGTPTQTTAQQPASTPAVNEEPDLMLMPF